ncbi:MAG TPA: LLM class flavin-dependent oxidoreductase [Streptosporangiaceae bacterium]|nr:LLM class flavin-dependent oxidoreductase [Streptosporangiaceae bacterium]
MPMRSGLYLPLFDALAEPSVAARFAAEAEEAGWHGVFVWDHVRWREPVLAAADPWITLAAVAMVTERVRLGPMVTPLARRRPVKVARETATLDRLSGGRLTFGAGLGSDEFGSEFSITDEALGSAQRARMLDESLGILATSPSTSSILASSPRRPPRSPRCGPRPTPTAPSPSTSSPSGRQAPTRPRTPQRARAGGWPSSRHTGHPRIWYGRGSARARFPSPDLQSAL